MSGRDICGSAITGSGKVHFDSELLDERLSSLLFVFQLRFLSFCLDGCFCITYTGEIIVSPEAGSCHKSPYSDSCERTGSTVSSNLLPGYVITISLFHMHIMCIHFYNLAMLKTLIKPVH